MTSERGRRELSKGVDPAWVAREDARRTDSLKNALRVMSREELIHFELDTPEEDQEAHALVAREVLIRSGENLGRKAERACHRANTAFKKVNNGDGIETVPGTIAGVIWTCLALGGIAAFLVWAFDCNG